MGRSLLTDEKGLPLSIVLSGTNTHDVKLLTQTLDAVVIKRPEASDELPQNLCLDAGFIGKEHEKSVEERNYIPHIRPRGEEKQEIEKNPDFKPRRWIVEICHSWFNRFRKLLVCFEKKSENYLNLLYFACSLISWWKVIKVHC